MTTPPQMPPQAPPQAPQAPPQAPQAPGGYASPIPIRRTHLGHAIASEWTKIRTVRSTVWTLVLMFALTVGVSLLLAIPLSGEETLGVPLLAGGFFGLMLGQLCVITLGALVITSEYGTNMVRTTLTACPQRGRVLLAKALVFFLLAFAMTLAACALSSLILSSVLGDMPVDQFADQELMKDSVDPETGYVIAKSGHWMGATVGAALYVSLLGLLSLAIGGLLRHSAGTITTMVGVVLLPLIMALFMAGESLQTLREKLIEYSPLNGLASLYRIPMQGGDDATGWPLLGLLAGVTVAVLIAAYARLSTTDA
jgi:hypothetical protein